ncbi:MACPF domain NSL1-like protein [Trifolium pratense]|uniref:MACPF domain NSL1-like protein n=1 Tax=Trifolium pratense TaxID=57577 RepID=A0A2K3KV48_TRIPR|nr:MACPF domain NSL1-like protein [Trifolium pratense]
MSEHFNRQLSLSGKIPSGQFNNMFDMRKYRTNITVSETVKKAVPSSWNPVALAE